MKTTKYLSIWLLISLFVFLLTACETNDTDLNTLKYLQGTVTNITTDTITIQTDDGQSYTFNLEGSDMSEAPDVKAGSKVDIVYTGILNGEDTANTALVKVSDAPASSIPADDAALHTLLAPYLFK